MFNDYGHCDGCGHLYCICAPAPEEKEMHTETECCPTCFCDECQCEDGIATKEDQARAAELRERWWQVYLAAWGGPMVCGQGESWPNVESMVTFAASIANATIAAWPDMTAERDRIIAGRDGE